MSVASEISRLQNAKASIKTAIENKGVTVPSSEKISNYSSYIASIQTGGSSDSGIAPNLIGFLDVSNVPSENILNVLDMDMDGTAGISDYTYGRDFLTHSNAYGNYGCFFPLFSETTIDDFDSELSSNIQSRYYKYLEQVIDSDGTYLHAPLPILLVTENGEQRWGVMNYYNYLLQGEGLFKYQYIAVYDNIPNLYDVLAAGDLLSNE